MKKLFILLLPVVFFCILMASCRTHERCAVEGKVDKTGSIKPHSVDKTEKNS